VQDLRPGSLGSNPEELAVAGDRLFFEADNGTLGTELWKYEPSDGGVALVKDIIPGTNGGLISHVTPLGDSVFFSAIDTEHGEELWRSNGTPEGTAMVRDIWLTPQYGSMPASLVVLNRKLFFTADDGPLGRELWMSDGTYEGTIRTKDIWQGFADSSPTGLVSAKRSVFFSANDGRFGRELWTSDGTAQGTKLVKDLRPGRNLDGPEKLAAAGTQVFFESFDEATGPELWVSNGTDAGTFLVKDIFPGDAGSRLSNLRGAGQTLYFSADDGVSGQELWKSDGTAEGTVRVMDMAPGAESSSPRHLTRVGMRLFFAAWSPGVGDALWAVELCDRSPPLLSCPRDMTFESRSPMGTPVDYAVTATDDLTDEPVIEYSHPPGTPFPVGVTPVAVQARDEAGNVASCTFQVTIRDSAAPTITCPRALLVSATSAEGAVVDYPEVRVVDMGSPVMLVYEPPEGTLFPLGESTRVTVTATDGAGNTATCQFSVTVEAPVQPEESGCGCGAHPGGALGWGSLLLLALTRRSLGSRGVLLR
jgi:ELWxxDGT repeat protein